MHKQIKVKISPYADFPRITRINDLPPIEAVEMTEFPDLGNLEETHDSENLSDTVQFIDRFRGKL